MNSSTESTHHGRIGQEQKVGFYFILLYFGDLTCHASSLEDAVAHLAASDPSEVLTIEK